MIVKRLFKLDIEKAETLEAEEALAALLSDEVIVPATTADFVEAMNAALRDDAALRAQDIER